MRPLGFLTKGRGQVLTSPSCLHAGLGVMIRRKTVSFSALNACIVEHGDIQVYSLLSVLLEQGWGNCLETWLLVVACHRVLSFSRKPDCADSLHRESLQQMSRKNFSHLAHFRKRTPNRGGNVSLEAAGSKQSSRPQKK